MQQGESDSGGRESAGFDQDLSESDAIVCIDIQDLNGSRSTLRFACQDWPYPAEMAVPLLLTRVKQRHGFVLESAREIRAFCQIAAMAAPRQV